MSLDRPSVFRYVDLPLPGHQDGVSYLTNKPVPVTLAGLAITQVLKCPNFSRQTVSARIIDLGDQYSFTEHISGVTGKDSRPFDLYVVGRDPGAVNREFLIFTGHGNELDRIELKQEEFEVAVDKILSDRPLSEKLSQYAQDLMRTKKRYIGLAALIPPTVYGLYQLVKWSNVIKYVKGIRS